MFAGIQYWIGLHALQINRTWMWIDGTSATYFDWANDEPNNKGNSEYCVHYIFEKNHQWNDQECEDSHAFICEGIEGV